MMQFITKWVFLCISHTAETLCSCSCISFILSWVGPSVNAVFTLRLLKKKHINLSLRVNKTCPHSLRHFCHQKRRILLLQFDCDTIYRRGLRSLELMANSAQRADRGLLFFPAFIAVQISDARGSLPDRVCVCVCVHVCECLRRGVSQRARSHLWFARMKIR